MPGQLFTHYFLTEGIKATPEWQASVADSTVGLVQRGYADDDIRKILGGNILRVAREVLGE